MELSDFQDRVFSFLRQNLLIVGLATLGLIFLGIGMIQFLGSGKQNNDSDIIFEKGSQTQEKTASVKGLQTAVSTITVDIEGAVEKPGVYKLSSDARIQDALIAAGGLSSSANRDFVSKGINQAAKLTDGAKIYIPKEGDPSTLSAGSGQASSGSTGVTSTNGGLININSASSSELDSLPGVGAVTSGKIIAGRPYASIEELKSKKVVSSSVFEKIKDKVSTY